ncbi:MAG: hypothetical protein U5R31_05405 [Acidimicrobiia bacterium]|nr:hypothetical protein [Acidimicrobiia bacterium]
MTVDGACPTHTDASVSLHPIARELLGIITDDYDLDASDGHRRFHFVRRRRQPES